MGQSDLDMSVCSLPRKIRCLLGFRTSFSRLNRERSENASIELIYRIDDYSARGLLRALPFDADPRKPSLAARGNQVLAPRPRVEDHSWASSLPSASRRFIASLGAAAASSPTSSTA